MIFHGRKRNLGLAQAAMLAIVFGLAGCATSELRQDQDALYYRLGARKELGKIVTDIVDTWAGDQRLIGNAAIKEKLQAADQAALKRNLFSFICWASEGPCKNKDDGLGASVKGLGVTNVEWFYMVEAIMVSLNKHNVPVREQNELMQLVYSLQSKVIGQ